MSFDTIKDQLNFLSLESSFNVFQSLSLEGSPFDAIKDQSTSNTKGQQEALATQATSRATKGQQEALVSVATSAGIAQLRTPLSKEHFVLTLVSHITYAIISFFLGNLSNYSLRGSSKKKQFYHFLH